MKRNITILTVVLALLFAGVVFAQTVKTEFAVLNMEATDGQLADLDKALGSNKVSWEQVLPKGWKLVQHEGAKGVIVPHTLKLVKLPKKMLLTNESMREEGFGGGFFLYGSRLEDQINIATGRIQRPFFRAVTTDGTVISGRELRQCKAESLAAIVRVIDTEITIITLI